MLKFEKWLRQKCEYIVKSMKVKPYTWGLTFLMVFVLIPVLICLCYYIGDCGLVLVKTSLSVDGLLSFYGSFLAFLGTMVLGGVAFWQNKRYQAENKKLNQKLFEAQIFASCAFFKAESCRVIFDEETNRFHLNINLRNVGKSTAVCAIPYELEFSSYGYKVGKPSNKIIIQVLSRMEASVLPEQLIGISSEPIECFISDNEDYFAYITVSIVSESQVQYDQEIQLRFKYINGKLKYLNEYPSRLLKLYSN